MDSNKFAELKKLAEESGNNLHYQVAKQLRQLGWNVLIGPYYNDGFTDKPREVDIVADKIFPRFDHPNKQIARSAAIAVRLFIECKYINSDTLFWFDDIDKERTAKLIIHNSSMNKNI